MLPLMVRPAHAPSDELIVVDQYCGGGGTTTGLMRAAAKRGLRCRVVAINHSDVAIATHQRNHPEVAHYCEDLARVNPRRAVPGGYVDVLVSSPSCTHFSGAAGGRPVNDQQRMGPWQITEWCHELDVRSVLVENVPEIRSWGPICTRGRGHAGRCVNDPRGEWVGCPGAEGGAHDFARRARACRSCGAPATCDKILPERKGETFRRWVREFGRLGYRVEYRICNAADHGAATSRRRFFLQAWKDHEPIAWPAPTHAPRAKARANGLRPWRAARDVLDLADRGRSMLERPKPLSRNTRLRIARGLLEFCGALGPHFVNLLGLDAADLARLPDVEVAEGPAGAFVVANRMHNAPRTLEDPLPTATSATGGGVMLVQPVMLGQHGGGVARPVGEPLPTIATGGALSVVQPTVEPFVVGQRDSWDGRAHVPGRARGVDSDPLLTITTDPGMTLVQPHIDVYYGNGSSDSVDAPLSTMTTKARHGLVTPIVVPYGPRADASSADAPLPTILTRDRLAVATPMVVPYHGEGQLGGDHAARSAEAPLGTIHAGGGSHGLATATVEPFLVATFGERPTQTPRVHALADPLPTSTSRGAGDLVIPAADPLGPGEVDPRRVVLIDGVPHVLNIYYRMLRVPELARGMGFDDGYWFAGTTRDATRMIGNAVEVSMAEALLGTMLDRLFAPAIEAVA